MSSLRHTNSAWVNKSIQKIPVYSELVPSLVHVGSQTVGGILLGHIWPEEFYVTRSGQEDTISNFKVCFRDGNGNQVTGYIETLTAGYGSAEYAWASSQYPYHNYNASGSSLVPCNRTLVVNGTTMNIFKLQRATTYKDRNNNILGSLPAGTEIATPSSTTGASSGNEDYMIFYQIKNQYGIWNNLTTDQYGYGFVHLDLTAGSMPSDRTVI